MAPYGLDMYGITKLTDSYGPYGLDRYGPSKQSKQSKQRKQREQRKQAHMHTNIHLYTCTHSNSYFVYQVGTFMRVFKFCLIIRTIHSDTCFSLKA